MRLSAISSKAVATLGGLSLALAVAGCAGSLPYRPFRPDPAFTGPATSTQSLVRNMPAPAGPVTVAVYDFPDLTGQYKYYPGLNYAENSKAVTQGGGAVLIDVLRTAGQGSWFRVVERGQSDDLMKERKLMEEAAKASGARTGQAAAPLPAIVADYIFAGGITGYDKTVETGGAVARYLGVGGKADYSKDVVTVTLRLTHVRTGQIVQSVTATKTVFSVHLGGGVSRFIRAGRLLEGEASTTSAEPTMIAVREAIEMALYDMMKDCTERPTWCAPAPFR